MFGCQGIESTAKTNFMAKKSVDYRVFDGTDCIYTVKNNVLEGFLVSMCSVFARLGK